jgi:hypothetical protein
MFDVIVSSHSIEHQPDFIGHLTQVENRLIAEGRYFIIVPDKRYCFDKFIAESTAADIMLAHRETRHQHNIKSVIEHGALTTHNDSFKHWQDRTVNTWLNLDHTRIKEQIDSFNQSDGTNIDVHAWYFTPDSFLEIINLLNSLNLISLKVERLYRTRYGSNEFWVILKKGECNIHPNDNKILGRERDSIFTERDSLFTERDSLLAERDSLLAERDSLLAETSYRFARRKFNIFFGKYIS